MLAGDGSAAMKCKGGGVGEAGGRGGLGLREMGRWGWIGDEESDAGASVRGGAPSEKRCAQ